MLHGKCNNGKENSNTPFVLARHRAHRLFDNHDALCIYVYYYSKENLKEGKRKSEEAARKHADGESFHDKTFLSKCLFSTYSKVYLHILP